jgi:hypothetical protein
MDKTLQTLLIIGGALVLVFTVAAILYYLQNNIRAKNEKAQPDEFSRRNDNRDIVVIDSRAETAKYNANNPPRDELAALELTRINDKKAEKEAAKRAKEAEREAREAAKRAEHEAKIAEHEAKRAKAEAEKAEAEARKEAARAAAQAEKEAQVQAQNQNQFAIDNDEPFITSNDSESQNQDDMLGGLIGRDDNEQPVQPESFNFERPNQEQKNGEFSFESFMERKEDIRNEAAKRDQKRAEKEAERKAEEEAKAEQARRKAELFQQDDKAGTEDLFSAFSFGQEPTAATAVNQNADMFTDFFKDKPDQEKFVERAKTDEAIDALQQQKEQYEKELNKQYEENKENRISAENLKETLAKREEAERKLKEEYDALKTSIVDEKEDLERKNRELLEKLQEAEKQAQIAKEREQEAERQAKLANEKAQEAEKLAKDTEQKTSQEVASKTADIEAERARIAAQLRAEYDQNEKLLSDK